MIRVGHQVAPDVAVTRGPSVVLPGTGTHLRPPRRHRLLELARRLLGAVLL